MKTITITGINNRYQIKKILNPVSIPITKKKYENIIQKHPTIVDRSTQLNTLNDILNKYQNQNQTQDTISLTPLETIIQNEIKIKLNSYKSQDIGNKFNIDNLISIINCIELLIKSNIVCYYCNDPCLIFYEHIRYSKQWTLDRIDNTTGHTLNNVVISCLHCNLQRKNKNSDKFLQSKQLKLIKLDDFDSDSDSDSDLNSTIKLD
jgi:hypothetical protein